jgi:hypothetical protein
VFKGWQSENDFNNNTNKPILYNLDETRIYSDMNLFAYYEVETVNAIASNLQYFKIDNNAISVKDNYKSILQGKITLPSTDANL